MEIDLHVSVREAVSTDFDSLMLQRFGMISADAATTVPLDTSSISDGEEQTEVMFLYGVATKRLAPQEIQARVTNLQNFLLEQQQSGNVTSAEFETDDEEAFRLLGLGLVESYKHHIGLSPAFLLITALEIFSTLTFSVYTIANQFAMHHALLRPEQVPLPLDDLWRRLLCAYYLTLLSREDLTAQTGQEDPLASWETWFSDQATDDWVLAQQKQHLALISRSMAQEAASVQDVLTQFPVTQHITFHQAEGFVCQQCTMKSQSARVAYYHGFLAR